MPDYTTALLQASLGPAYKVANPDTTPDDIAMIRKALGLLPERPEAIVRMHEAAKPTVSGQAKIGVPEIWMFRRGQSYKSGDPLKVAGTILHEGTHLANPQITSQNEQEVLARQAQLQFLRDRASRGEFKDKGYLRYLDRFLKHYQRELDLERKQRKPPRQQPTPGDGTLEDEIMQELIRREG